MSGLPSRSDVSFLPGALDSPAGTRVRERLRDSTRQFAAQDWVLLGYHLVLVGVVLQADRTEDWPRAIFSFTALAAIVATTLTLVRGNLLRRGKWAALLYRLTMLVTVEASYFEMRRLLPMVSAGSFDQELYAFDVAVFGFEPAMLLEPLVTAAGTEWFSFAYYGYFLFLLMHVAPLFFLCRHRRALGEFALGLTLVFCCGHLVYFLVPGFGPGIAMPDRFEAGLPAGFWANLMNDTVRRLGAQKDIFPSIHTAVPVFLSLWGYRYRKTLIFGEALLRARASFPWFPTRRVLRTLRHLWLAVAWFSANIVIATMYLRWHYLADVLAGLVLGTGCFAAARVFVSWEFAHRRREQLSPVWPRLEWGRLKPADAVTSGTAVLPRRLDPS